MKLSKQFQQHAQLTQEYTDDTAELRREVDALGGMAGLQDPEKQMQALPELEQYVSAVCHPTQLY